VNTFVEHFVTMITQVPVIINEPFTQKLTIPGSSDFQNVQNRLLEDIKHNGSDNRLDIFVHRIRPNCTTNCTMNVSVDGKNPITIPGDLSEYSRY